MGQPKVMQGLVSRIAIGVFGLLTIAIVLLAVFNDRGALALRQQRKRLNILNAEINTAIQTNKDLHGEIEELRHDPDAIERRAREQLKLVKPGEVILQLPPTPEEDQPPK